MNKFKEGDLILYDGREHRIINIIDNTALVVWENERMIIDLDSSVELLS